MTSNKEYLEKHAAAWTAVESYLWNCDAEGTVVDPWYVICLHREVFENPNARGYSREVGVKFQMMIDDPERYAEMIHKEAKREAEQIVKQRIIDSVKQPVRIRKWWKIND